MFVNFVVNDMKLCKMIKKISTMYTSELWAKLHDWINMFCFVILTGNQTRSVLFGPGETEESLQWLDNRI